MGAVTGSIREEGKNTGPVAAGQDVSKEDGYNVDKGGWKILLIMGEARRAKVWVKGGRIW